jgi:hypothetical protein
MPTFDRDNPLPQRHDRRALIAKYPGVCAECGKPFAAGDAIYWHPSPKVGPAHQACHSAVELGGQPKGPGAWGAHPARMVLPQEPPPPPSDRALLDERWAVHRADVAAGRPTRAGVWAEMLVLAKRLGDEATAEVAADEMRRAVDRQTTR